MTRIVVGRVLALIPTLLLATFIIYLLLYFAPGDPAVALAGENATAAQIEAIRVAQGFDQPMIVQYARWLWNAVQGNLGVSYGDGIPVATKIGQALPATLFLVAGAMIVAVGLGVIAGIAAARRANSVTDTFISAGAATGAAIPSFWLGLVLVVIFALGLHWFPATGFDGAANPGMAARQIVLPSIALGMAGAAEITRQLRAAMMDVLASDHVRTLRAKGLPERSIIWRHARKGSGVPLMTVAGLQVSRLLGATVVVEAVFGIGGLGTLVVKAAATRDYPVVEGAVVLMAIMVIATNFVVDISYRLIDPRIR